jgi:hypothetical protein
MAEAGPRAARASIIAYNKAIQTDAAAELPLQRPLQARLTRIAYGWMMKQPNGKQIMVKLRTNSRSSWDAARPAAYPAVGFTARSDGGRQGPPHLGSGHRHRRQHDDHALLQQRRH